MMGPHTIKAWSRQQRTIALSSAEAETHGMVACSCELLGIQSRAKDLGITVGASVYADASAALGIIQRRGIGKLRHIQTQCLWLQEAHATNRLHFEKIDGSRNPSDLLTTHLSDILMDRHMKVIGALPEDGRASTAPTLASLGINELPLYGYVDPEGVKKNPNARSELSTSGVEGKQSMPTGAHAGSPRHSVSASLTRAGGGSSSGVTGPAALSPHANATYPCRTSGCRTTGSCLADGIHAPKEASAGIGVQETTVEYPVTPSVHRSGSTRCVKERLMS